MAAAAAAAARAVLHGKRTNPGAALRKVAIVGGTHGNERAGVHLIQFFEQCPEVVKRASFETVSLLSSVEAVAADRRYIAKDLNCCFDQAFLDKAERTFAPERSYEARRCLELDAALGPRFSAAPGSFTKPCDGSRPSDLYPPG